MFDSRQLSTILSMKNALFKAFIEVRNMVEAVLRYSNFEVNVLSRLQRISRKTPLNLARINRRGFSL